MKKFVRISAFPEIDDWSIESGWDYEKEKYGCSDDFSDFDNLKDKYITAYKNKVSSLVNWEVLHEESSFYELFTILKLKDDSELMNANNEINSLYTWLMVETSVGGSVDTSYYPGTQTHYTGWNLPEPGYYEYDQEDVTIDVWLEIKNDDLQFTWSDDPDEL